MHNVVISGTGLFTPANSISNAELVAAFNAYVQQFNADNAAAIERGEVEALSESSEAFIEKASGIKSRYVMDKAGILDPQRMTPRIPERPNEEWSILCEMAVGAAKEALQRAGKTAADIDGAALNKALQSIRDELELLAEEQYIARNQIETPLASQAERGNQRVASQLRLIVTVPAHGILAIAIQVQQHRIQRLAHLRLDLPANLGKQRRPRHGAMFNPGITVAGLRIAIPGHLARRRQPAAMNVGINSDKGRANNNWSVIHNVFG